MEFSRSDLRMRRSRMRRILGGFRALGSMTRSVRAREDVELEVRFFDANATSSPASPLPPPRPSAPLADGSSPPYFARSFNSNVVVAMVVLLLALAVAAFINTVARVVLSRRRQRASAQQQVEVKGLDSRTIEALPVVAYGVDPRFGNDVECVVCLSEFAHGEKLRMLPECHHAFHVACIDAWLATHKTCPVCRQSVARSARFASARIASVDTEAAQPDASVSARTSRSLRSTLPSETLAILVYGALGSRRFGLRS